MIEGGVIQVLLPSDFDLASNPAYSYVKLEKELIDVNATNTVQLVEISSTELRII